MNAVPEGFTLRFSLGPAEAAALLEHHLTGCRCAGTDNETGVGDPTRMVLEALLDRLAGMLPDSEGSHPALVVTAMCLECEDEVDPVTRRHLDGEGSSCEHGNVPESSLAVDLACPCCGRGDIAEVNVGEVWDEVGEVTVRQGVVVLSVLQRGGVDREGDGWICLGCRTRLRLPADRTFDFEYE